jgi:cytochrome P450/NADPH-cytochrome P450 reductase
METLGLKSTLTVKPVDFRIKVTRRPGKELMTGIPGSVPSPVKTEKTSHKAVSEPGATKSKLLILYGSNAGTCKALAEELQTGANERGFEVEVKTMDHATEQLPTDHPVAIITPSYEGKPADNAKKFVAWLESCPQTTLNNVKYGLFGVGNSEWVSTFHRIPKLLNELLPNLGAAPMVPTSYVDVREDLVGPWEDWRDSFLAALGGEEQLAKVDTEELTVTFEKRDVAAKLAGEDISEAIVRVNREIANTDVGFAKRHTEVELPLGMTYRSGGTVPKQIPILNVADGE